MPPIFNCQALLQEREIVLGRDLILKGVSHAFGLFGRKMGFFPQATGKLQSVAWNGAHAG